MAESVYTSAQQRRAQELIAERRRAAYRMGQSENSGGSQPAPTPTASSKPESKDPEDRRQSVSIPKPPTPHKTYQKHVLFAVTSAFILQLIAAGKSLPTSGS